MFPEDLKRSQQSVDKEKLQSGHEKQHYKWNAWNGWRWFTLISLENVS